MNLEGETKGQGIGGCGSLGGVTGCCRAPGEGRRGRRGADRAGVAERVRYRTRETVRAPQILEADCLSLGPDYFSGMEIVPPASMVCLGILSRELMVAVGGVPTTLML